MEIRNIITFLRVAELLSFTKAAEELGYSQSAITVQIKQLEEATCVTPTTQHSGQYKTMKIIKRSVVARGWQ